MLIDEIKSLKIANKINEYHQELIKACDANNNDAITLFELEYNCGLFSKSHIDEQIEFYKQRTSNSANFYSIVMYTSIMIFGQRNTNLSDIIKLLETHLDSDSHGYIHSILAYIYCKKDPYITVTKAYALATIGFQNGNALAAVILGDLILTHPATFGIPFSTAYGYLFFAESKNSCVAKLKFAEYNKIWLSNNIEMEQYLRAAITSETCNCAYTKGYACTYLALRISSDSEAKSLYKQSLSITDKMHVNRGMAAAFLGHMYYRKCKYKKVKKYYKLSYELGYDSIYAKMRLAQIYKDGADGKQKNIIKAIKYYVLDNSSQAIPLIDNIINNEKSLIPKLAETISHDEFLRIYKKTGIPAILYDEIIKNENKIFQNMMSNITIDL